MILPIVKVPHPVLFGKAAPVTRFDTKLKKLIGDMTDTLVAARDPEGVGLAAPQVGISLALFVTKATKKSPVKAYINAEILEVKKDKMDIGTSANKAGTGKKTLEGCLSINRIWAPIRRSGNVRLRYQTPDTKIHEEWFKGFEAVIIQHEVDHLHGVLFTQRALEQKAQLYEEIQGELEKIEM